MNGPASSFFLLCPFLSTTLFHVPSLCVPSYVLHMLVPVFFTGPSHPVCTFLLYLSWCLIFLIGVFSFLFYFSIFIYIFKFIYLYLHLFVLFSSLSILQNLIVFFILHCTFSEEHVFMHLY